MRLSRLIVSAETRGQTSIAHTIPPRWAALSVLRAATSISALTLLSRILGLARDMVMATVLGPGFAWGVFNLAWMVPNLLRRLLGEGALSAAFIPAYSKTLEADGEPAARHLLAGVSGALLAMTAVLATLVIGASFLLPPEIWCLEATADATSAERGTLMWDLTRSLFGYSVPICLLALYAGALNARGIFALPAAAPIVLNVIWISCLAIALANQEHDTTTVIRWLAWSLLGAGVLQLMLGLVPLARCSALPRPRLPKTGDGSMQVFRTMLPTVLGLSLVQVNMLMDQGLAFYIVGEGANNHLYLANRLLLFPHALVTIPLATAVFPRLALLATQTELATMSTRIGQAVRLTTFLAVPAAVGMIVVAPDLIDVTFVHGQFKAEDAPDTIWTSIALVAGLPMIGAAQLYARGFFAMGDTKTPARVAGWLVLLNFALNLLFVLGLGLGVAGFALATTVCASINAVTLRRRLVVRCGTDSALSRLMVLRTAGATAAMVVAILAVRTPFPRETSTQQVLFGLLIPIGTGIATYAVAHWLLRTPELRTLAGQVRRKFTRRG